MAKKWSSGELKLSTTKHTIMKTSYIFTILLLGITSATLAQNRFFTRTGTIRFFSETPVENIEAINNQSSSVFDIESGEIAVSAQMKGFEFEKALMQEHFNENYMESEKYPTATFKGSINKYNKSGFKANETYTVEVEGDLTMHGVTKRVNGQASIVWGQNNIKASSSFNIKVADFDIKIPKAVIDNIAESILVNVDFNLEPYNK